MKKSGVSWCFFEKHLEAWRYRATQDLVALPLRCLGTFFFITTWSEWMSRRKDCRGSEVPDRCHDPDCLGLIDPDLCLQ